MRIPTTKSLLSAAIMAVTLLGNGVVLADAGRYHGDRQNASHHRNYGHEKRYQQRYPRTHRYSGHADRGYYHKGHYGRHVTNYYEYDDDDDDEKLLIGIALGGLLGYAITQADHQ
jgi:hypothetical protein